MANDNFARGLVPLIRGTGRTPGRYYLASTGNHMFLGQPVAIAADGRVTAAGTGGLTVYLGVAGGFLDSSQGGIIENNFPYLNTANISGTPYVFVWDDPMQEYYVQEDTGGSTRLQLTDIGATAALIYRGSAPNTAVASSSGWVQAELQSSSIAATTAQTLQVLGLLNGYNTDGTAMTTGNYAKWVVRIMHSQRAGGLPGAAV